MNSWNRSDSDTPTGGIPTLGLNDEDLLCRLVKSGPDHRKFMRFINVTVDITAPLYWWKEFDTYKVGTVANSCSTMHKIAAKEFVRGDFSHEHLTQDSMVLLDAIIDHLNARRNEFIAWHGKEQWWQLIQMLPSSYNQKRTVQLNYEVLFNMFGARKAHKLDEWREFCRWVSLLPYAEQLITSAIGGSV